MKYVSKVTSGRWVTGLRNIFEFLSRASEELILVFYRAPMLWISASNSKSKVRSLWRWHWKYCNSTSGEVSLNLYSTLALISLLTEAFNFSGLLHCCLSSARNVMITFIHATLHFKYKHSRDLRHIVLIRESLSICWWNYKGSTCFSVLLRTRSVGWVRTWTPSRTVVWCSTYWVNR